MLPPHCGHMKMTCCKAGLSGVEEQDMGGVLLAMGISDCTTSVISGRYSAFVWTHTAAMAATCAPSCIRVMSVKDVVRLGVIERLMMSGIIAE